jgi:hypothetical protein
MIRNRSVLILTVAMLTGCTVRSSPTSLSAGEGVGGTSPTTGETAGSTSAGSTGGETAEDSSAMSTSTTAVYDVGIGDDLGGGEPVGCRGKIDFLFVISDDQNLKESQPKIIDAFPKFIDTIASKFDDFDYHVMVIDGTDHWGDAECTAVCPDLSCLWGDPCCPYDPGSPPDLCCPDLNYPCELLDLVTQCDNTLGAGSVFPAGFGSTDAPCLIDGGRRYMTKEQSDLSETFACVAQVGTHGSNHIGDALAAAVSPSLNGPGRCNEGFLRDDALLMVTLITPGYDRSPDGTVQEWYEAILSAKNGNPEAVVMFVVGNPICPLYDEPCQLAIRFPNVEIQHLHADDYGPGFDAAAALVEDACDALIPG